MYSISKQFSFSAAHSLQGLSPKHPCTRLHGHNYVVTVYLKSEQLNETGFVCDYKELDKVKEYIDTHLDHQNLNDIMFPLNPTAENLAKMLYDIFKPVFPQLYAVEVSETPKTSAVYEPEGE
ncbi:MAG: 6-carboxytetrahydropterin synthase QueD [Dysgonamonadaceae bacterium]|jgi:6-pyruvoyltetrahydropterin/6-carboxytetrahydropterin synthase|nr:6-carboxytetrahydropterin synthase QueD [Dysgonamonadaceae bacterium]MDD3495131.1 6-carboxytetrahydropterin synthase QueD [Dysgonamonadaceae bacterium]MDD4378377.1 6-carboxytetrahydropterin synthase QueD [Dysgonamonadaceae bacterium]